MPRKNNRAKGPEIFSDMTCEEMTMLREHLLSGRSKQQHHTEDHDGFWETSGVVDDLHAAYRTRWNRENPKHQLS